LTLPICGEESGLRNVDSNSDLLIEAGRWINLQREERKCRFCTQGVVEDEAHALLDCGAYVHERRAMFDHIREFYGWET